MKIKLNLKQVFVNVLLFVGIAAMFIFGDLNGIVLLTIVSIIGILIRPITMYSDLFNHGKREEKLTVGITLLLSIIYLIVCVLLQLKDNYVYIVLFPVIEGLTFLFNMVYKYIEYRMDNDDDE